MLDFEDDGDIPPFGPDPVELPGLVYNPTSGLDDDELLVNSPSQPKLPVREGLYKAFPFSNIREAQISSLDLIAKSIEEQKPFTIIDAPTGSGKSALAMATAIWSATSLPNGGAHYLTSQNSLSDQVMNDGEVHGMNRIKGKANYVCHNMNTNCQIASTLKGETCQHCPYRAEKNRYIAGKIGVTNYAYYIAERRFAQEIDPRHTLILDEAHNIEKEVLALADIYITPTTCRMYSIPGGMMRFVKGQDDQVRDWLSETFLPALNTWINVTDEEIRVSPSSATTAEARNKAGRLVNSIELFVEAQNPKEWLAWTDEKEDALLIRPLTAAGFAHDFLFSGSTNILMMSATILNPDTFRRTLGIPKSKANTLMIPSDFPVKNRRVVAWPAGSMSAKNIKETMPLMIERVIALLGKFQGKKGIIHTHTYSINETLTKALMKTPHAQRILTHDKNPQSRLQCISKHLASPKDTVILSPSCTEGLDLKGDLSRFQIIPKVPYPSLNEYIRARIELDPKWYQQQTATTLIQGCGRSIRDKDDEAVTIILDSDFIRFIQQNQDIFQDWWLKAIEFK